MELIDTTLVGKPIKVAELKVHEFKGTIPTFENYENVDINLLTKGDDDPMYVTLAILGVGQVSENGILYDEELVSSIEKQLEGEGGIRGHLGFFNSNEYPYSEIDWIGHLRDATNVTWAKGYVPPGANRDEIRRIKARNGKIGTSIYGYANDIEEVDDDVYRLIEFELITLDLVHHKMASLKMGQWSGFTITAESKREDATPLNDAIQMLQQSKKVQLEAQKEKPMPTAIQEEKTAGDINAQLEKVAEMEREHGKKVQELEAKIAELSATEKKYGELCAVLENTDDPKSAVVGMQAQISALTSENTELLKDSITKLVEEAVKVESVRPLVIRLVNTHNPTTREAAVKAVTAVVEAEDVKALLVAEVGRQMGPKQEGPLYGSNEEDQTPAEFSVIIPEA